jgi:hypothetical protein
LSSSRFPSANTCCVSFLPPPQIICTYFYRIVSLPLWVKERVASKTGISSEKNSETEIRCEKEGIGI